MKAPLAVGVDAALPPLSRRAHCRNPVAVADRVAGLIMQGGGKELSEDLSKCEAGTERELSYSLPILRSVLQIQPRGNFDSD